MNIIVGISGGIAAYKAPHLVRLLKEAGHDVRCVATAHALEFVTRTTLETVSGHALYYGLFDGANEHSTEHISLKDWCDATVVAPATANIIGKLAAGIADDALSTLLVAVSRKPLYMCPTMNSEMWANEAVQRNIGLLRSWGVRFIGPDEGHLACGVNGVGRMSSPESIAATLVGERRLKGMKVLVTAGPTYEKIDPVRFIGNFSTGKMGAALASALLDSGAVVELVLGPTAGLRLPESPMLHIHDVVSAQEMYEACMSIFPGCEAAILSAAVADYRPIRCSPDKMKKHGDKGMSIELVQNPDILASLGTMKNEEQTLVGFALETTDEMTNARKKLEKKRLDYIVLNSLRDEGAGFGTDTNKVTILSHKGEEWRLPLMSKREVAEEIIKKCL